MSRGPTLEKSQTPEEQVSSGLCISQAVPSRRQNWPAGESGLMETTGCIALGNVWTFWVSSFLRQKTRPAYARLGAEDGASKTGAGGAGETARNLWPPLHEIWLSEGENCLCVRWCMFVGRISVQM